MSTRESTTPPVVPTVTTTTAHAFEDGYYPAVYIRRAGVLGAEAIRAEDAEQLAAYLRGALADAYSAGVADGQRLPNLAPHEIDAPDFGGQTEHGQA
jgi:hypothetical protein